MFGCTSAHVGVVIHHCCALLYGQNVCGHLTDHTHVFTVHTVQDLFLLYCYDNLHFSGKAFN